MKFQKLTPSLIVSNVEASLRFYCDVLAFQRAITVPDVPPYAFGSVTNGDLEIFFTEKKAAEEDYPQLATREIGGTLTLFIEVEGLDELMATVKKSGARTIMPLKTQFYGMREFAFEAPDGWMVTFAERVK